MATSPTHHRAVLALAVLAPLSLSSRAALAYDADVSSTTAAQAYSLRSPFGDPVLYRRRITETLGLGVYNLLDNEQPGSAQLSVKLRMRFDADVGVDSNEVNYAQGDSTNRYVPGLRQAPLDLMYGYLEGKNLLGGYLGFRLGRQYVTDALGWWSFDGANVNVSIPYVRFEAYGGYEQRGGLPLSSGRFEQNGVWRGDRSTSSLTGAPDAFPMFQAAHMAPAYGFGVESAGPYWIHGRFDYRKVYNQGDVTTLALPNATGVTQTTGGTRTSSERIGYSLDATIGDFAGARGGLVYDLYNALFASYYANVDAYLPYRITVGADFDFYRPTFDGDSIFNFFTHEPMTTLTGRLGWSSGDRFDIAASGGIRWWETDDDPNNPTFRGPGTTGYRSPDPNVTLSDPEVDNTTKLHDWLGNLSARYRWQTARAGLHGLYENGERGRREGGDLSAEKNFHGGKWMVEGRASLFDWKDDLRPDQSTTSFGYVAGGGWRAADYAQVLLEWEQNMNHIVGQRYRILAVVNLLATK